MMDTKKKLYYKRDSVSSMRGGKYYSYYFKIVDGDGNDIDHPLNDSAWSLTQGQVNKSENKALRQCKKLGIESYLSLQGY